MMTYEIHPAADLFPMMSPDEFEGLTADIREHGQRDLAVLWEGKILDGRNRYRACTELGINVACCDLDRCADPIAYVLSKNLHRRQLDKSQRAIIAAKAREMYAQQAKGRKKRKPKSVVAKVPPQKREKARDAAGKALGVSGRYVDMASAVLKSGDVELIAAVDSGAIKLPEATRRLEGEGKGRAQPVTKLPKPERRDFDTRLRDAVVNLWRCEEMPVCALAARLRNLADRLTDELTER